MKVVEAIKIVMLAVSFVLFLPVVQSDSLILRGEECDWCEVDPNDIPEGYKIIEGDILVPIISAAGVYTTQLWPDGVVPYEFDPNVTSQSRTYALEAMVEWEVVSGVDFVERDTQTDYVYLQNSSGFSSAVGKVGGKQVIDIYRWDLKWKVVHELGHTLGYWHEHTRSDRDTYITIIWENIYEGKEGNFYRHDEADFYGPYDFGSMMHYNQCGMSKCGVCRTDPDNCRTILVNPPWDIEWQDKLGHAGGLSDMDKETALWLYHDPEWIFVDRDFAGTPELGTFDNPYKTLGAGVSAVPQQGTIMVFPGTYDEANTYTKPMKLRSHLGGVVLQ